MGIDYAYLDPKASKQVMLNMLTQDRTQYLMCEDREDYAVSYTHLTLPTNREV